MTLLLGFAAVNTGNNLLYLLVSALLGFMAVSGVLGRGNIAGLEVTVEAPDEIYDGVETMVRVRLENRHRFLPAFIIRVSVDNESVLFPFVGRGTDAAEAVKFTFQGRGARNIGRIWLCSIFPINFFVRCRPAAAGRSVTVFPAPVGHRVLFETGPRGHHGELPVSARGFEGEINRIGHYRGEPLKLIHWKLSARHDELMVKELSTGAREPVILDLDALPGANLEERLRCASFLINQYHRESRPVGLQLDGRILPPATGRVHKLRLLHELAIHGQD